MAPRVDQPQPGYYRRRQTKGGVWVGVLVYRPCPIDLEPATWGWIDRYPTLLAYTDGRHSVEAYTVWTSLRPVTKNEYEYLVSTNEWAREHAPHLPQANPHKAVDLDTMQPLF